MKQIPCPTCRGQGFVMARGMLEEVAVSAMLEAADRFGISVDALRGRSRDAGICRARTAAIKQMRAAGLTLKEIGLFLGGRDHSTIIHALQKPDQVDGRTYAEA